MDLPSYTLRYSKKAKYLQIRLSRDGLQLVVPDKRKFSSKVIDDFIQTKKAWILKHWQEYTANPEPKIQVPNEINLEAMQQVWEVKYVESPRKRLRLMTNLSRQITLIGDIQDIAACTVLLKRWLKSIAQKYLVEALHEASVETGLVFNEVSIRNNLTRWGSCSSQKNISLCCKLLLLPYPLMRHVLVHELCHTKVMNHGPRFWKLFETFDSNAKFTAQALKLAAKELPAWIK